MLTDEQRIRIWPAGMGSPMNETVEKVSSAIAAHLWRGSWPPSEVEYRDMEPDLRDDADGVLVAALDIVDLLRPSEDELANRVEPYLLALRSAVSRAEYEDDRRDLQALFDLIDGLE